MCATKKSAQTLRDDPIGRPYVNYDMIAHLDDFVYSALQK
jgi:hypothetical protein